MVAIKDDKDLLKLWEDLHNDLNEYHKKNKEKIKSDKMKK